MNIIRRRLRDIVIDDKMQYKPVERRYTQAGGLTFMFFRFIKAKFQHILGMGIIASLLPAGSITNAEIQAAPRTKQKPPKRQAKIWWEPGNLRGTPESVHIKKNSLTAGHLLLAISVDEGHYLALNDFSENFRGPQYIRTSGFSDFASVGLSPNKKLIAVAEGALYDVAGNFNLFVWPRAARLEEVKEPQEVSAGPTQRGYLPNLAWSTDGRFIAFIGGTPISSATLDTQIAYSRVIYDTKTKRSRTLPGGASDDYLSWTSRNTLLGVSPDSRPLKPKPGLHQERRPPAVFEIDPVKGTRKRVADAATGPAVESPNGVWLAFRGFSPLPTKDENTSLPKPITVTSETKWDNLNSLQILNLVTGKRYAVPGYSNFTQVFWTSDSKRFIAGHQGALFEVEPSTLKVRHVAQIAAYQPDQDSASSGKVDILGLSQDGKQVILANFPHRPQGGKGLIQTVDIAKGEVSTAVEVEGLTYAAWAP